jgi:hypothetical protein
MDLNNEEGSSCDLISHPGIGLEGLKETAKDLGIASL